MKIWKMLSIALILLGLVSCGGSDNADPARMPFVLKSSSGASLGYVITVNTDSIFVYLSSIDRYMTLDQRTGLPPTVTTTSLPSAYFAQANCSGDALIGVPKSFQGEVGKTIFANNSSYYLISKIYPISQSISFLSTSDASGGCSNGGGIFLTYEGSLLLQKISAPVDLSDQAPLVIQYSNR